MKTNLELVAYCKKMLGVDTIYCLGTFGQNFTSALLNQKCNQLPWNAENRDFLQQFADKGTHAFDCCGLIKGFMWDTGGTYITGYNASEDENEAMMYDRALVKGPISTLPETPGILVFMEGHVGVYIGNGQVIECTPNMQLGGWGVLKSTLDGRGWTKWAQYARIEYTNAPTPKPEPKPEPTPHKIGYKVHMADIGYGPMVYDGDMAGTTGQGRRVEAIMFDLLGQKIKVKAHLENIGWVDYGWITDKTEIGTTGESRRLEALCLEGNIEYRVHIADEGWSAWTHADGIATLGTVGMKHAIEAIEIRVLD